MGERLAAVPADADPVAALIFGAMKPFEQFLTYERDVVLTEAS